LRAYILSHFSLHSWKNYKKFPDGLIYEGVSTKPMQVGNPFESFFLGGGKKN
jgi:hypothetical protein